MNQRSPSLRAPILLAACAAGLSFCAAVADDTTIDFDDLAPGTVVTTQYPGVTFSAPPGSCGGAPPVRPIIVTPAGGTSSGTQGLSLQTGCPDFSPDYLRIVFDQPHGEVSFTLGNTPGTYTVRVYNTPSGGAAVSTQNVVIGGAGFVGVYRLVRVTRALRDIRRIEIQDTVSDFEVIDDLTFDCPDTTPPVAEIEPPLDDACLCNLPQIRGTASDPESGLQSWRLERRAAAEDTWVLINTGTGEIIDGLFATWNTNARPTGYYLLRLTVTNGCGLISTAVRFVYLDKTFNNLTMRSPAEAAVLGGSVCFDGTAWDHCAPGNFRIEYRPVGGGAFGPIDALSPPWVINDPLGSWNTRAGIADGDYEVRATAADSCGNAPPAILRRITIDNTPPTAQITQPLACEYVSGIVEIRGTVNDAHLAGWRLDYTGGDAAGWVPLAAGAGPVLDGVLFRWDTAGLRRCAYTLRLIATDQAVLDCNGVLHNQSEDTVSVIVGCEGDIDLNGVIDLGDLGLVLANFGLFCP